MRAMPSDQQNWRDKAKCKDLPVEEADRLFFVGRGGKSRKAKRFCNGCPVRTECLAFASYYNEEGIWGGLSDTERRSTTFIGMLTTTIVSSYGVNTTETRDYRQWGLTESQIQKSRKEFQESQESQPEIQVSYQQEVVLVVEL